MADMTEYLVKLGAEVDQGSINKLVSALNSTTVKAAGLTAALSGIGVGLYKFIKSTTEAEFTLESMAKKQHKTTEAVRASQNALTAMGKTLQEVKKDKALNEMYKDIVKMNKALALPNMKASLQNVRDLQKEFYALKSSIQYLQQWINYYLLQQLAGPMKELKEFLKNVREWLNLHMDSIARKISVFLVNFVRGIKSIVDLGKRIGSWIEKLPKSIGNITVAIAAAFAAIKMGPIGKILALLELAGDVKLDYENYQANKAEGIDYNDGTFETAGDGYVYQKSQNGMYYKKTENGWEATAATTGEATKQVGVGYLNWFQAFENNGVGGIVSEGLTQANNLLETVNDAFVELNNFLTGGEIDVSGLGDSFIVKLKEWFSNPDNTQKLQALGESIWKLVGLAMQTGGNLVGKILDMVFGVNAKAEAGDEIAKLFAGPDNPLNEAISNGLISGLLTGNGFIGLLSGLITVFAKAKEDGEFREQLKTTAQDIGNRFMNLMFGEADASGNRSGGLWKEILDTFDFLKDDVVEFITPIWDTVKPIVSGWISEVGGWIQSIIGEIPIWLYNALQGFGMGGLLDFLNIKNPNHIKTVDQGENGLYTITTTDNSEYSGYRFSDEEAQAIRENAKYLMASGDGGDITLSEAGAQRANQVHGSGFGGGKDWGYSLIGPKYTEGFSALNYAEMISRTLGWESTENSSGSNPQDTVNVSATDVGAVGEASQEAAPKVGQLGDTSEKVISAEQQMIAATLLAAGEANNVADALRMAAHKLNNADGNSEGARIGKETLTWVGENNDPEYIIPIKKPGRAIPLIMQMLGEMGSSAIEKVTSGLGIGGDSGSIGSAALASATAGSQIITNINVSAPVSIVVQASGADGRTIGNTAYNAAQKYLVSTLRGVYAQ